MGCRCNERREAIVRTVEAAATGEAIPAELPFVVKSAAQHTANAFRQSVAAAKSRLSRR
jgi:hypothetical protein